MKKKDMILAVTLLAVALLLFLLLRPNDAGTGAKIQITVDGKPYGTYSLLEEQEILVEQESGTNRICVQDGVAWMVEADCPDQYCIGQGKIGRKNQTIVCLPHRLVVEVVEAEESAAGKGQGNPEEPDAVVH